MGRAFNCPALLMKSLVIYKHFCFRQICSVLLHRDNSYSCFSVISFSEIIFHHIDLGCVVSCLMIKSVKRSL